MKNLTSLLAVAALAALPFTAFAGALDRPGTATPAPGAPGATPAAPANGVGTSTALAPSIKSLKVMGIVVQKQPNGIVINPIIQRGKEKPKDFVFIEGDFSKSFNGDKVTCMATDSGTYDYKPTGAAIAAPGKSATGTVPVGQAGQIRKMTFVRW
ncbi:MAG TPA: hypothetical protein VGO11_23215 [Chthoniobacteraceae bacterium]|jgi:hypothetical protein|nr:hypothetical protein [Chthoniobacteraceae bacterium]